MDCCFVEINNSDLLLFDMTTKQDDPAIILLLGGQAETIAERFSELKIQNVD